MPPIIVADANKDDITKNAICHLNVSVLIVLLSNTRMTNVIFWFVIDVCLCREEKYNAGCFKEIDHLSTFQNYCQFWAKMGN